MKLKVRAVRRRLIVYDAFARQDDGGDQAVDYTVTPLCTQREQQGMFLR
ncbi:MAG: hypothetical protein KGL99_18170 [Burkholderiales bacterium]|nr:hypothetical protein [Burkholderiales bacterium]